MAADPAKGGIDYDAYYNSYGNYAGQYLEECLPNITEGINSAFQGHSWNDGTWGAIRLQNYRGDNSLEDNTGRYTGFTFDASRSNAIYRDNCKMVRSKSYVVYMWRRAL